MKIEEVDFCQPSWQYWDIEKDSFFFGGRNSDLDSPAEFKTAS